MSLFNTKPIKIPTGALFYFTAFLVVFYFFFTKPETAEGQQIGEGGITPFPR